MQPENLDLERVRIGLANLDRIVEDHPELRESEAQERLSAHLRKTDEMPGRSDDQKLIAMRWPDEMVQRADALAKRLEKREPGSTVSRSAAIRIAFSRGAELLERELPKLQEEPERAAPKRPATKAKKKTKRAAK